MRIFALIILSLVATVFMSAVLLLVLPLEFEQRMLWVALLEPLIWGSLMLYCYWDASVWRAIGVLIGICVVSSGLVLANPMVI